MKFFLINQKTNSNIRKRNLFFGDAMSVTVIKFKIKFNKNIKTGFDFKNWKDVIIKIFLWKNSIMSFSIFTLFFSETFKEFPSELKCFGIDARIIITNDKFFERQIKNLFFIRIMIFSIIIRNIKINKHLTNKYVIVSINLIDKNQKKTSCYCQISKKNPFNRTIQNQYVIVTKHGCHDNSGL